MDQQQILKAADQAAWIACNPNTSSPAEVEELGILAVRDLRDAVEAGDGFGATVALGMALGTHRAMVCRGMDLDALDLFSRLNAATTELAGHGVISDGHTYTEYVEAIRDWFAEA